ncbi:MAG: hypothetical protein ACI9WS_003238 [Paraglaciecola psychrophila]
MACGEFAIVYVLKLVDVPVGKHRTRYEKLRGAIIHCYGADVKAINGGKVFFNVFIGCGPIMLELTPGGGQIGTALLCQ